MAVTNYVNKISREQAEHLRFILEQENWELDSIPYALFRARKGKTSCVAYESGKLVIQGKETEELVQFTLEPRVLEEVRLGYETYFAKAEHPEMFQPHAGIDESGKGDFFGPLVVACCYVEEESATALVELGVQDSKNIKSDKKIDSLAGQIRETVQGKFSLVRIGPPAYNRLYAKLRNVNRILAWGHARTLENLLEKQPGCPRALSDQFGPKSAIENVLMEKGRKIKLEQRHRAEEDIAVAAASILARDEFVKQMARLSEQSGLELPRGASAKVLDAAVELIKAKGPDAFNDFAKRHFSTAEKALRRSQNDE